MSKTKVIAFANNKLVHSAQNKIEFVFFKIKFAHNVNIRIISVG